MDFSLLKTLQSRITGALGRIEFLPPLIARITVGYTFVESGWGKLHDLPKVVGFFTELGIPWPEVQAPMVAGLELVCGALVLTGLASRIASLPLIAIMAVAIATAKREELGGLSELFGFIEWLYIVLLMYVVVLGPGVASVDRFLTSRQKAEGATTS